MLQLLIEYKKAIAGAFISVSGAFANLFVDITPHQLDRADQWIGIIVKLLSGIAAIYTIYEIRRKRKARQALGAPGQRPLHPGPDPHLPDPGPNQTNN